MGRGGRRGKGEGAGSGCGEGDEVGVGRIRAAASTSVSCWFSGSLGLKSGGGAGRSACWDVLTMSSGLGI